MVSLRVPATTANLGPGFDCLGCALNMYARFTFEQIAEGLNITGCPPEYVTLIIWYIKPLLLPVQHGSSVLSKC